MTRRPVIGSTQRGVNRASKRGADLQRRYLPGALLTGADYESTILINPTLIGYWPLDEASGNAIDHGPHGYDLTVVGTPTYHVAGADATRLPFGVHLDGTSIGVPLDDDAYTGPSGLNTATEFTGHAPFTVEAWINPGTQAHAHTGIFCNSTGGAPGGENGWNVALDSSNKITVFRNGATGSDVVTAPVACSTGAWTYVAVTFDGADVSIYYNGDLQTTTASARSSGNGSSVGVILGALVTQFASQAWHYVGSIQHVAVYSSALTDQEVLEHWASAGGITEDGVGAVTTPALADGAVTTPKLADGAATEDKIGLSDVTTDDVTSTKHGFAPKSPADATKFLNGASTPVYALVKDSDLSTSDVTTNDVSTTKHGFVPKLPNDATKFFNGVGGFSTPSGIAPGGAAGGSLTGTYPNPTIAAGAITATEVAAANKDGTAATPSLRTLGTGAQQAAAGNDSRLSDSRAPSGAAGGDLTGTFPNPTLAATGPGATGPLGDGTHVPVVTIDAKGRVTGLTSTPISNPTSIVTSDPVSPTVGQTVLNTVTAQFSVFDGSRWWRIGAIADALTTTFSPVYAFLFDDIDLGNIEFGADRLAYDLFA